MFPPKLPMPPTREQILAQIRQQNSGHLIEQIIELEADKADLTNRLAAALRRVAELERDRVTAEPTDAGAAGL